VHTYRYKVIYQYVYVCIYIYICFSIAPQVNQYLPVILKLCAEFLPAAPVDYSPSEVRETISRSSVLQFVAECCIPKQCVAVCCSALQCVEVCDTISLRRPHNHDALQHTATHCNTLQRTATHRNAPQRTATHRNAPQRTAAHCNALQHTATHCNTLQPQQLCGKGLERGFSIQIRVSVRELYICQPPSYFRKRALSICKRALSIRKRALSIRKNLQHVQFSRHLRCVSRT